MNKIKKVLQDHLVISEEIRIYFTNLFLKTAEEDKLPESFVEHLKITGVPLEMLETYLNATPGLICEFMDDKDVIILTTYNQGSFSFTINGKNDIGEVYRTRKSAEIAAVVSSIIEYSKM